MGFCPFPYHNSLRRLRKKNNSDIIQNQQNLEDIRAITGILSDWGYDFNGVSIMETNIYGTYSYCRQDIILIANANGCKQIRQS